METLILHPTDTAQWYMLVNEAEQASSLTLNEDMESYLVFLLIRFTTQPAIVKDILAMDFLKGLNTNGQLGYELLRELGDKCLLFSGLFPHRAQRYRVKNSYVTEMGRTAYSVVSSSGLIYGHKDTAQLFDTLSEEFVKLRDVLCATRDMSLKSQNGLVEVRAQEYFSAVIARSNATKPSRNH